MRRLITICSISAMLIAPAGVQARSIAQHWPARTVKLVVPTQAGGGVDRVNRFLAQRLAKMWKQPVIILNKPGATTIVGTAFVAHSPPNGYTLLSTLVGLVQTPALHKHLPYNVETDLEPITTLLNSRVLLLVRAGSPYHNIHQLIAAAKAREASRPLDFGTGGVGHSYQIFGAQIAKDAHVKMIAIPYHGERGCVTALLGSQVDFTFASVGTSMPLIKGHKLRTLGIVGKTRWKDLPNLPTLDEQGVPMPNLNLWFGMLAPAKTPAPIVNKISVDVRKILAEPATVRFLATQGMEPAGSTPQAFAKTIHHDLYEWKKLEAGVGVLPK